MKIPPQRGNFKKGLSPYKFYVDKIFTISPEDQSDYEGNTI